MFNEPDTSPSPAIEVLREALREGKGSPEDENATYIQDIAVGDFNIHDA